jgi:hypothetical protein
MRFVLSFLVSFCVFGYINAQTDAWHPWHSAEKPNPPDRNPQYFPVASFSKTPQLSDSRARWYASELRDLQEPSLWRGQGISGTIYRFLLIPPFTPSLSIRLLVHRDGTATMITKLGTKRSQVATLRQQTIVLTPDQVAKFLGLLQDAHFWALRSAENDQSLVQVMDGREWLMEANKHGKYHVVDRGDGAIEVGIVHAAEYLQELSPLKVETLPRKRRTGQPSTSTPD